MMKMKISTYIYFILLLKLGWIVCGYHRNVHMIVAQLRLAKMGHAFCDSRIFNKSVVVVLVGFHASTTPAVRRGVVSGTPPPMTTNFAKASTARANT